jgi:hypothetical protein
MKSRSGKNEKKIIEILKNYEYIEYSQRLIVSKILGTPYFE